MALLNQLRTAQPEDAGATAMFARLAFEQRRWDEALAAFRLAVRLDTARASDAVLINGAIDSLQYEPSAGAAEALLRELGATAKPILTVASEAHPMAHVRARARALLGQGGASNP